MPGMEGDRDEVGQLLCMNSGAGENSYAKNSDLQRTVIYRTRHILKESVEDMCRTFSSSKWLAVADLGCATGPNALVAVSEIVNIVCRTWDELGLGKRPSFLMFLNDLPRNDFNAIFRSLGEFYDPLRIDGRESFVTAVSGSFYDRVLPSQSLHFAHSSYSLHWLSQVPEGLNGENGEALNKGNICIGKSTSLAVQKAYAKQFKKDFKAFLTARSEELIPGGSMVLTFSGSPISNAPVKEAEVIGLSLVEMAKEGLIKESKLDTFNLPVHKPSEEQIKEVIIEEGWFSIRRIEVIKTEWGVGTEEEVKFSNESGQGDLVAKCMRAATEPLLVDAFGEEIIDELFRRVSVRFTELMNAEDCFFHNIVVWLTRNERM